MSLVQGLAVRVTAVGADLPIGQVAAAADRIRTATGLLAATLHASAAPPLTPLLVAAGDHLDHAAGAMRRARDELDRYLVAAVGVSDTSSAPQTFRDANDTPHIPSVEARSFWVDRVDRLTDLRDAPPPERVESTVESLLLAVVTRARAGDRAGLRDALAAAPAATGLALAPLAAHLLRRTMGADFPAVRRAALARLGDLLPGLDAVTPVEILARAAHRPIPPRDPDADGPAHPVDPAVAGPVLLAGLVTEDELTRLLDARAGA